MASIFESSTSDDEFGYDLSLEDEQLLATIADGASASASASASKPSLPLSVLSAATTVATQDHVASSPLHGGPKGKPALKAVGRTHSVDVFMQGSQPESTPSVVPVDNVQYPDLSDLLRDHLLETTALGAKEEDSKPPLLRFRTFPRKPFSVSDLTAGAWCELQYEYTLTRLPFGKRTRTAAMRAGTQVHQKLEDQVHTTVQIEIATKEDAFGLRIWNIVQGLRTLRDTGLTRELEVWGYVDGNLVNGVIDVLSHHNPNPEFEEEWLSSQGSQSGVADESQKKMTDFFASSETSGEKPKSKDHRKIYLTDVKTRGVRSVPKGVAIRSTKVQLYLYHRFLAQMAEDKIDFLQVFKRYGLDAEAPFSDALLAQLGELHDEIFHDSSSVLSDESSPSSSPNSPNSHALLRYRTLKELASLLRRELRATFPAGADNLGSVVTVEYRLRGEEGALIGSNILAVDTVVLDQYLEEYMQWWRGERPAAGVDIEEAYKCSYCEFAEICRWRQEMDLKHLNKAKEKKEASRIADGADQAEGDTMVAP